VPAAAYWDWNAIRLVSGDVNGDHRADLAMMYHFTDGSIGLFTSLADTNGHLGAFTTGYTVPAAAYWDWNAIRLAPGDFNGDGRADLAIMYHFTDGSIGLFTSLADTNGHLAAFTVGYTVPAAAYWDWNAIRLISGDVNGDHRADLAIMYHFTDGSIGLFTSLADTNGHLAAFTVGYTVPAAAYWDWNAIRLI
jgi:hypothetical protein